MSTTTDFSDRPSAAAPAPLPPRRRDFFKKALAVLLGGIVVAVPSAAGLLTYFDPLRRRGNGKGAAASAGAAAFTDIAPLSALPADGVPRRFQVLAERVDAWNKHPAAPVGAVYLKRDPATPDKVTAFNVVCPHAGCFVEPGTNDQPGGPGGFFCPCHNSSFHPDGRIVQGKCVSPRGLDELAVDEAALKAGTIRIRFQNFIAGTHDKIPTA